eukprot:GGOE01052381.1.p1 GENE.GGOE01052381.1~~GGOE01052381.1.p1  ORF type:complete len:350 (+),score=56.20 GGOE01052381.1:50-1051(+)
MKACCSSASMLSLKASCSSRLTIGLDWNTNDARVLEAFDQLGSLSLLPQRGSSGSFFAAGMLGPALGSLGCRPGSAPLPQLAQDLLENSARVDATDCSGFLPICCPVAAAPTTSEEMVRALPSIPSPAPLPKKHRSTDHPPVPRLAPHPNVPAVAVANSTGSVPPSPAFPIAERMAWLLAEFRPLSPQEKYRRLLDMGRALPPYSPLHRLPQYKVDGCQSTVFLRIVNGDPPHGPLAFEGWSDALISAGLVALVLQLYNNQTAADILRHDPSSLQQLGLFASLSLTRAQGLASVVGHVRRLALESLVSTTIPAAGSTTREAAETHPVGERGHF